MAEGKESQKDSMILKKFEEISGIPKGTMENMEIDKLEALMDNLVKEMTR